MCLNDNFWQFRKKTFNFVKEIRFIEFKSNIKMKLNKLLTLFFLTIITFACKKDETNIVETNTVLIQSTEWQIDKFTTASGDVIDPTLFGGNSKLIGELTYVFDKTFVVRSYDKVSKQAQAYGSWSLIENDSKLNVNIQGFTGIFDLVTLSKQKMTLRNNIVYAGVEIPVNMEFIPLK